MLGRRATRRDRQSPSAGSLSEWRIERPARSRCASLREAVAPRPGSPRGRVPSVLQQLAPPVDVSNRHLPGLLGACHHSTQGNSRGAIDRGIAYATGATRCHHCGNHRVRSGHSNGRNRAGNALAARTCRNLDQSVTELTFPLHEARLGRTLEDGKTPRRTGKPECQRLSRSAPSRVDLASTLLSAVSTLSSPRARWSASSAARAPENRPFCA